MTLTFPVASRPSSPDDAYWDERFGPIGVDKQVNAIVTIGNALYVGGDFTLAGGIAATNIAMWDGARWSALGIGLNGSVNAMATDGNILYAGGGFTSAGGVNVNGIAKWDGTRWSTLGNGQPVGRAVFSSVLCIDGIV